MMGDWDVFLFSRISEGQFQVKAGFLLVLVAVTPRASHADPARLKALYWQVYRSMSMRILPSMVFLCTPPLHQASF